MSIFLPTFRMPQASQELHKLKLEEMAFKPNSDGLQSSSVLAPSSGSFLLLVVRPGAPSSVLAP